MTKNMQKIKCLLVTLLLCSSIGSAYSAPNPRYAAIVLDADSGKVLHARHADAMRYPASLTKMMTLYLLFEAMDQGLMTLDTAMPVSAHAASMPQTNISLKKGDKLRVRDAIPALIVRSANDVAVVVAEALAGTESAFAKVMTNKAKAMNMKSTTFRNASGLPDSAQRTTARDLSTLSKRLMQDHASYYHYFSTRSFTFRGKTYNSHNRLIKNYPGTDGMKTGYIRASGFNVATSTVKGEHRLVAVVMGGRTAQSRDAAMIDLLDKSFIRAEDLAKKAPKTPVKPQTANKPIAPPKSKVVYSTEPAQQAGPNAVRQPINQTTAVITRQPVKAVSPPAPTSQLSTPALVELDTQLRSFAVHQRWAIQVGSFRSLEQAKARAADAAQRLGSSQTAKLAVNQVSISEQTLYRAQLVGLQQSEAKQACERLERQNMDCLVVRMAGN